MPELTSEQWIALEQLLNQVANEREEDDDGPGSMPSKNANNSLAMIKKLGMIRNKPLHLH